jgi:chromosome segregation ATPase
VYVECREDLQRDEEIFAEKVRELKSYRKKLRQIEKENGELKEKLEDAGRAQQQQWQLRSPVRSPLRRRGTVQRSAFYDSGYGLQFMKRTYLASLHVTL